MAELKTNPTATDPAEFVAAIEDEQKRADAAELLTLLGEQLRQLAMSSPFPTVIMVARGYGGGVLPYPRLFLRACTRSWRHLRHLLVDPLIHLLLLLRGLVRGQPTRRDILIDALVGSSLERCGQIGGILAVRLGDLGQRLTGQLLLQL